MDDDHVALVEADQHLIDHLLAAEEDVALARQERPQARIGAVGHAFERVRLQRPPGLVHSALASSP